MILQALHDYYYRKMADPDPARRLPAAGLESKAIPFLVELSLDGLLVTVKDTRTGEGKKRIAAQFLVPLGVKKTSGVAANLLWDTAEYCVGIDTRGNPHRVAEQHRTFRARIDELPGALQQDAGIVAVKRFLDNQPLDALARESLWDEIRSTNPLITFRLADDEELVCQRAAIVSFAMAQQDSAEGSDVPPKTHAICLLTGDRAKPERVHASIKGVWGAQSSGANIVSFNLDAFNSFGKEQGNNAPVSAGAAFSYTTALNHLLGKGSRNRFQVGDASTVFWAQRPDQFEDVFAEFFAEPDDPDRRANEIRALLQAVESGKFDGGRGQNKFYVLGLAPNAARIAVRFWYAAPLCELAACVRDWFDDLAVVRGPNDPEYPSLFRLLTAVSVQGKADNIPPGLGGEVMRSILAGIPFPVTWLNAAVQRCRAERKVTYQRAAAIKACLNRQFRYARSDTSSRQKELKPMLDKDNSSAAYRLGRLFAVLEKIQEEASPGLNATIRDRYYGAASSVPVAVFTTLLRLKNHHLAKLESRGRAVNFERLIGEIMAGIVNFPAHLLLPDQGRFALGYYHQRQALFTRSADSAEKPADEADSTLAA